VKAFLTGVIIGFLLIGAGVGYYFISGAAPAAVEDKPMPMEKFFASKALDAHIEKEMPKSVPIAADETAYLAGADVYQQHCAICHGLPNVDQTPMAKGMFPKPPALFKGKGVTDDPAGETYWKVANGIRLTGMPEFKHALNDTQMWQVSLLLANADKISDAVKDKLKPPPAPAATGAAVPPASGIPAKPGRVPISPHSTPKM
jgi:mono/diheme cytochrome c family protein